MAADGYAFERYVQQQATRAAGMKGASEGDKGKGGQRRHEQHHQQNAASILRSSILQLRRSKDASAAAGFEREIKAALLRAEEECLPVDGALIGMAAAHAGKLGLKSLVSSLCAFMWSRLSQCEGREVAELASAAAKLDCQDDRFFHFVGSFCQDSAHKFSQLRDVALLAAALLRHASNKAPSGSANDGQCRLDVHVAFQSLAVAAVYRVQSKDVATRDLAEFLHPLAHALAEKPFAGGGQRVRENSSAGQDATKAIIKCFRSKVHQASPQDVAKVAGAIAVMWPQFPHLQDTYFLPCIRDISQAFRFRREAFNTQDLTMTAVALVKVDEFVDDFVADVLSEEIKQRAGALSHKDLSLMLWVCSQRSDIAQRCAKHLIAEFQRRDPAELHPRDLCMLTQACAKLPESSGNTKNALSLLAAEAFRRQLHGFSTTDKALLFWVMAKTKVRHLALCRCLVRELAVVDFSNVQRDVVSAALWALGMLWQYFCGPQDLIWPGKLSERLCASLPWRQAPPYEVANAAWALHQMRESIQPSVWISLVSRANELNSRDLAFHELCNLACGFVACMCEASKEDDLMDSLMTCKILVARFAEEILLRVNAGEQISAHDTFSLESIGQMFEESAELFEGLPALSALLEKSLQRATATSERSNGKGIGIAATAERNGIAAMEEDVTHSAIQAEPQETKMEGEPSRKGDDDERSTAVSPTEKSKFTKTQQGRAARLGRGTGIHATKEEVSKRTHEENSASSSMAMQKADDGAACHQTSSDRAQICFGSSADLQLGHGPYEAVEPTCNCNAYGSYGFFPSSCLVHRTHDVNCFGGTGFSYPPLSDQGRTVRLGRGTATNAAREEASKRTKEENSSSLMMQKKDDQAAFEQNSDDRVEICFGSFTAPQLVHGAYEASGPTRHGRYGFFPSSLLVHRIHNVKCFGGTGLYHAPVSDHGSSGKGHGARQDEIQGRGYAHSQSQGNQHESAWAAAPPPAVYGSKKAVSPSRRKRSQAAARYTPADISEHVVVECGNSACCPDVSLPGADSSNRLRLNSHCDFPGHCVQLKNTFIHVECTAQSDSDDCELCMLTRPRARSLPRRNSSEGNMR